MMKTTASAWRRLAWAMLAGALAIGALALPAAAQESGATQDLTEARARVDAAQKALAQQPDDDALLRIRTDLLGARALAESAAERRSPPLDSVRQQLVELGSVPAGQTEAPDVRSLRQRLEQTRALLDGEIRLARLTTVDAQQLVDRVGSQRRARFQNALSERTPSLLSRPFWTELRRDAVGDTARLAPLGAELRAAVRSAPAWVWPALGLALAALIGVRIVAGRKLMAVIARRAPAGRLRRSLWALAQIVLTLLAGAAIASALRIALGWSQPLSESADSVLDFGAGTILFSSYIVGLGQALLAAKNPSWRLSRLPDAIAARLRPLPWALAIVLSLAWLAERLSTFVNAGLPTSVALNSIVALVLAMLLAVTIWRIERLRRRLAPDGGPAGQRPRWQAPLVAVTWLIVIGSVICLLAGYVALGSFIVKQVAWVVIVGLSAFVLDAVIEDGSLALLSAAPPGRDGASAGAGTALQRNSKLAVLGAAIGRVVVLLVAVMLVLAPFGNSPADIAAHATRLRDGLAVGTLKVEPMAVLRAMAALVITLWVIGVVKRWLLDRFLPTTQLDDGLRLSTVTLFGYAGAVVAVTLALSAAGIGLERIAWIASALSVGIGFGLQAVVQNFVSGLILLAERPIKIGDWIAVGDIEGDVQRINVRATEIRMNDRSIVMVPNSELITKAVRNVTLFSSLGRVQIKLPLPLGTDVVRVRDILVAAFEASEQLVDTPSPTVLLHGIENGLLVFNATGYVESPRQAYAVRSALLFEIMIKLHEAGIDAAKPSAPAPAAP